MNNNAAAALISLAALAAGREVMISRGELVEIGGGFRVPDVMAQSGAILREVGTTNRTRVSDYAAAISERTALILRVHPSNFTMEGFTERAGVGELAALGRRFNIPVVEDLGSGFLGSPTAVAALDSEPSVADSLTAGVTLVMFSGDKLLGGPQAGLIVGSGAAVGLVRRHPLMRALRADKMTYAALEATLEEHAAGRAAESIPVVRMIALTADAIGRRADALVERLSEAGVARRGRRWILHDRRRQRPGHAIAHEARRDRAAGNPPRGGAARSAARGHRQNRERARPARSANGPAGRRRAPDRARHIGRSEPVSVRRA